MPAQAGYDTRVNFLWEEDGSGNIDFTNTSDSDHKTFGYSAMVDDLTTNNNPVALYNPGNREAAEYVAQNFAGSWSMSFTLANPWFWRAVIADVSSSGSSPTTHTFDGTVPFPMQIIIGNEDTGNERTLKGAVVGECTLDVSDSGEASVTLSGVHADEDESSPGVGSLVSQDTESFEPLTFADGSLTFDSTTFSLVQSVSLTISNNIEMIPGLGSRTAQSYRPGERPITIDWGKVVENDNQLVEAYGASSAPASRMDGDEEVSGDLTFDNGESGANQNKQVISFAGSFPDSYSRSGTGDPSATHIEDITYTAREIDVVATNAVSSAR